MMTACMQYMADTYLILDLFQLKFFCRTCEFSHWILKRSPPTSPWWLSWFAPHAHDPSWHVRDRNFFSTNGSTRILNLFRWNFACFGLTDARYHGQLCKIITRYKIKWTNNQWFVEILHKFKPAALVAVEAVKAVGAQGKYHTSFDMGPWLPGRCMMIMGF